MRYLQYKWGIYHKFSDMNKDGVLDESDAQLNEEQFAHGFNLTEREVILLDDNGNSSYQKGKRKRSDPVLWQKPTYPKKKNPKKQRDNTNFVYTTIADRQDGQLELQQSPHWCG